MIEFLKGKVSAIFEHKIVIQNSGIGFAVYVPQVQNFSEGIDTEVHIHMHWNQDSGPSLFGFSSLLEKQVFQMIVGCSGIGPKIALSVLGFMSAGKFLSLITESDAKGLSSVNGIGIKKAENIIVQLKHKVSKFLESGVDLGADGAQAQSFNEVSQVLTSLNYSRTEITAALDYVKAQKRDKGSSLDVLLRTALAYLSKQI